VIDRPEPALRTGARALDAAPGAPAAAQSDRAPAVQVREGAVRLGGRTIWEQVSIGVRRGEFVALLGPNGAGKSTLLKVILGLLPLATGEVSVLGQPPGRANREIGYLPQRRSFDQSTRIRGIDIVELGLDGSRWGLPLPVPRRWASPRRRADRARVAEAIDLVGAGAYARRPIGELSGGEQQRLLIAQALVRRPQLLILDEPLDSLDLATQSATAALIQRICRREDVAIVLVAHDVNPLLSYLDRVIYLAAGRAVEGRVDGVITSETLTALHGIPVEVLRTSDGRLVVVGQPEAPFRHNPRHIEGRL
jgi:zinc/manganese transport system ATP-binding protein